MSWALAYSERARRQLRKMDPGQRAIVLSWMDKNIDGCDDPRAHGKGLTANRSGQWRYRIGDYRVLCDIVDEKLTVLAIEIGHRSKLYER